MKPGHRVIAHSPGSFGKLQDVSSFGTGLTVDLRSFVELPGLSGAALTGTLHFEIGAAVHLGLHTYLLSFGTTGSAWLDYILNCFRTHRFLLIISGWLVFS